MYMYKYITMSARTATTSPAFATPTCYKPVLIRAKKNCLATCMRLLTTEAVFWIKKPNMDVQKKSGAAP